MSCVLHWVPEGCIGDDVFRPPRVSLCKCILALDYINIFIVSTAIYYLL